MPIMIVLLALLLLCAAYLITAHICARLAFAVPKDKKLELPATEQYAPYIDSTEKMIEDNRKLTYERVFITSHDGLKLCGYYYEVKKCAPLRIMFHGYRSHGSIDFCGGLEESIAAGCNALVVDQRAHGLSEGKYLTFGIKERYDVLSWVDYAVGRFGKDQKIVLLGMSMGASTVLMASGLALPENVIGIIADCGYSSPSAIIKKVIADEKYPRALTYHFVRAGGRIFGGFDIEETSATDALAGSSTPTLFIHGDDDRFVPYEMGVENYTAYAANNKKMLTVNGAGHALSYMVDRDAYMSTVNEFLSGIMS